ncbi:MAG: hypothetical protein K2K84_04655 [Muribaculaceae bacterium]|nr:hypothetical protein [Muribaculaceae bacterium]
MIKKFFAIAAIAMVMASCGGYSVDGVIDDIKSCETTEELQKLTEDKDLEKWIEEQPKEDQTKIAAAFVARGIELSASDGLGGLLGK